LKNIADIRSLHFQLILCDELKVELIEVGKTAVPALCIALEFPYIITPNLYEHSGFAHILKPGDKDPCCTTVIARNLCFVWYRLDDLICYLFAMVTVSAVG
jgi:hypothetical protein